MYFIVLSQTPSSCVQSLGYLEGLGGVWVWLTDGFEVQFWWMNLGLSSKIILFEFDPTLSIYVSSILNVVVAAVASILGKPRNTCCPLTKQFS